jgi:CRISPR-associated protein Csx17
VPVNEDGTSWSTEERLTTWGPGLLVQNLVTLFRRRQLEAIRADAEGELLKSESGAPLEHVMRFLSGETDDRRIASLLLGLSCVRPLVSEIEEPNVSPGSNAAYGFLKVFFTPERTVRRLCEWAADDLRVRLPREIPNKLTAGNVDDAIDVGWQRLRAMGAQLPGIRAPRASGRDGRRLLAALIIPLTYRSSASLFTWLGLRHSGEPERRLDSWTEEATL